MTPFRWRLYLLNVRLWDGESKDYWNMGIATYFYKISSPTNRIYINIYSYYTHLVDVAVMSYTCIRGLLRISEGYSNCGSSFSPVPSGKNRNSTSIRALSRPSNSFRFVIHLSSWHPTLYSLDTDKTIIQPTQKKNTMELWHESKWSRIKSTFRVSHSVRAKHFLVGWVAMQCCRKTGSNSCQCSRETWLNK
jgi:hypothetical protein